MANRSTCQENKPMYVVLSKELIRHTMHELRRCILLLGLSRKVVADEGVIAKEKQENEKLNADIDEYEQKSWISRVFSPSVRK